MPTTYDSTAAYPRDLIGYGRNPPRPVAGQRPHRGAVRPELRGRRRERVLHGDPGPSSSCPRCSTRQLPRAAPEHGRHLRIRLARRRLAHPARVREARPAAHRVRRRHGAAAHPDLTAAFVELGHEIACHGWRWIHYQDVDEATEREHMRWPWSHRAAHRRRRAHPRRAGTPAATAPTRAAWWPTTAASNTTATTTATTCRSG
jgi:allantoinase